MARRFSTALHPFTCSTCPTVLGWTAPGEASQIGKRAHVFCQHCRDIPVGLTDKQTEFIDAMVAMRDEGIRPTIAGAADRMEVSRSRAQQIAQAIRARGFGASLDEAMRYGDEPVVGVGYSGPAVDPHAEAWDPLADMDVDDRDDRDFPDTLPVRSAPPLVPQTSEVLRPEALNGPNTATNPTDDDPAATAVQFM